MTPMAVPWSFPWPATLMTSGGSIRVYSIMWRPISGSSSVSMKWLLAPVSTVMVKLSGAGAVCTAGVGWTAGIGCDVRKEKPTPAGGADGAVADPGGCWSTGLYWLITVAGDGAVCAWPKLA